MRKLIAVALLASPLVLNAAEKGSSDNVPSAKIVSSGVKAPNRIHDAKIEFNAADFPTLTVGANVVKVAYVVDAQGVPTDIHITQSVNSELDQRVLDAVAQFRYEPGVLNGQKVAVPVDLAVKFEK